LGGDVTGTLEMALVATGCSETDGGTGTERDRHGTDDAAATI
jgi:hypothetical protein